MDSLVLPGVGNALYIAPNGQLEVGRRWDRRRPTALLPGAFNPIHAGHRGLAAVAAEMLGLDVAFELSVANVDKPALGSAEVRRRLAQFSGAAVWLSHAPRFADKAELFPGAVFVVGADTAARIVDPHYHDHDRARMDAAFARLRTLGCRFLVACRVDAAGHCVAPAEVAVPAAHRDLFLPIPPQRFRLDISSSVLRQSRIK